MFAMERFPISLYLRKCSKFSPFGETKAALSLSKHLGNIHIYKETTHRKKLGLRFSLSNKLIIYFILDKLFPSLCLSFLFCKMSSWIRWFSRSTRADSRMKITVRLESTALPSLAGVGVGRQLYESPKPRTDLQPSTETY